jgi:hypothetical protein
MLSSSSGSSLASLMRSRLRTSTFLWRVEALDCPNMVEGEGRGLERQEKCEVVGGGASG